MTGARNTGSSKSHRARMGMPTISPPLGKSFEARLEKELIELGVYEPPEVMIMLCLCVYEGVYCCCFLSVFICMFSDVIG